jgi:hypothetical protein
VSVSGSGVEADVLIRLGVAFPPALVVQPLITEVVRRSVGG